MYMKYDQRIIGLSNLDHRMINTHFLLLSSQMNTLNRHLLVLDFYVEANAAAPLGTVDAA